MNVSRIVLPFALTFAVSTAAWAGMASDEGAKVKFSKLDKDGNGRITKKEVRGHEQVASHFSTIDANGDGVVTRRELKQSRFGGSSS